MYFIITRSRNFKRGIFLFLTSIIFLIILFRLKRTDSDKEDLNGQYPFEYKIKHKELDPNGIDRVNAVILVMCRNSDFEGMRRTMRKFEDRFNRKFNYPYIFFNEVEFSDKFKKVITYETTAEVTFSRIPKEHWSIPSWINVTLFKEKMSKLKEKEVPYAELVSYHHMCRYQSGPIFLHPDLARYDYYWRIEPDTELYCDINYDPFRWLIDNNKLYGFTISLREVADSVTTLFRETLYFMRQHKKELETDLFPFFMDPIPEDKTSENWKEQVILNSRLGHSKSHGLQEFNLCHFWSNFEIASLNFFRSSVYQEYFQYLDQTGGFYYERWGDAPIHSLGLGMLVDFNQIHRFEDIGYRHADFSVCPNNILSDPTSEYRCHCPLPPNSKDFYTDQGSCLPRFKNYQPRKLELTKFVAVEEEAET